MSQNYQSILVSQSGAVAHITINRADKLNALSKLVLQELHQAVDGLSDEIRCVVIAGAGEKAFVAGADIAEMSALGPDGAQEFARLGQSLTRKLESASQVFIAKVQGFALGGGCELAMACDLILASKKAKFGQPEVSLGLIAGFGGTQRLVKRIGTAKALDLLCAGAMIGADEANAAGLVSRVCGEDELDAEVAKTTAKVLKQAPGAIALTKRLAYQAEETTLEQGLAAEASAFGELFAGQEAKEGMSAFLEKRPASFVAKPEG